MGRLATKEGGWERSELSQATFVTSQAVKKGGKSEKLEYT